MNKPEPVKRHSAAGSAGLVIVILIVCGVALDRYHVTRDMQTSRLTYRPAKVCDSAWQDDANRLNQHGDQHLAYFDVELVPGCFSGYASIPDDWTEWNHQFMNQTKEDYVAFWFKGVSGPYGPFTAPQNAQELNHWPSREFRLQGHGTLRFYKVR